MREGSPGFFLIEEGSLSPLNREGFLTLLNREGFSAFIEYLEQDRLFSLHGEGLVFIEKRRVPCQY